jgi:ATP-dependent DNA helicase RecG
VYLTTNPLSGHTYRRLNDGDRALPDEEVKRMLAEQVNDSRDDRILKGYDVEDLDAETLGGRCTFRRRQRCVAAECAEGG